MSKFIGNAFSAQMLDTSSKRTVDFDPVSDAKAAEFATDAESCVGHPDTAAVISDRLGTEVPAQRKNISLEPGDELLVGQLTGGRLPEGTKTLPEGFTLEFLLVKVQ